MPTVWLGLVAHLELNDLRFSTLQRIVSGGSAVPPPLVEVLSDRYGVEVRQGWGMTETVAVATVGTLDSRQMMLPPAERHAITVKQGKSVFGVEIKSSTNRATPCRATACRKASS